MIVIWYKYDESIYQDEEWGKKRKRTKEIKKTQHTEEYQRFLR